MTGPCTWPVSYPSGYTCSALDSATPEERAQFEQMATDFLWAWTGRSFGLCDVTIRPCRDDCSGRPSTFDGNGPRTAGSAARGGAGWGVAYVGGQWRTMSCGTCTSGCSCSLGPVSLALPGPVDSITEVRVDGSLVDQSAYRVDNWRYLVRLDGGVWPKCQDQLAHTDQPGTFVVSYKMGAEVPAGGQLAAGLLACEMAKAVRKDNTCALPQRIQTITRQGVTMTLLDNFDNLGLGQTGIWLVDSWVASVTKPRRSGSVHSVDLPRERRAVRFTTWPRGGSASNIMDGGVI